jgi:hypothetical protein
MVSPLESPFLPPAIAMTPPTSYAIPILP